MPTGSGFLGLQTTFEPAIIDLEEYEARLRLQHSRGIPLMPPAPIPGLVAQRWTVVELDAMRRNRREAEAIYQQIKVEAALVCAG